MPGPGPFSQPTEQEKPYREPSMMDRIGGVLGQGFRVGSNTFIKIGGGGGGGGVGGGGGGRGLSIKLVYNLN